MKINYASRMDSKELIKAMSLNRNIAAVLESSLDIAKLKRIIKRDDVDTLMELKGIGPITAQRIVTEGKKLLAKRPDHVHMHIDHYSAPMYGVDNMLDAFERESLTLVALSEDPKFIIETLTKLVDYECGPIVKPLTCIGYADYNAMPRSMLSDLLNIPLDSVTDKLCIYRHQADNVGSVANEVLYNVCKAWERNKITDLLDKFRKLFVHRSVEAGFITEDGTHYVFFTASPGQLKKGSGYWMREDCMYKHQTQFWGGLTPKIINNNVGVKGIVMTKILQYRALLTSSSMPSSEVLGRPITLDNMICTDEPEKLMKASVMSVSEDYEVSEGERDDISNNMFDGWFAINERVYGKIHMQSRMYGIKGLGVSFDWEGYAHFRGYDKNPDCYKITDIDGVVHDLSIEKNITVIMNTSVFKMKKMYGTWKNYVECMKRCGFGELYICAINEEEQETKKLSRQMMQTLFSIDEDSLEYMSGMSRKALHRYCDIDTAIGIMSDSNRPYNKRSNLGKLVSCYPEVLALECMQKELRDRYTSEYDSAMCGELKVNGRYYFAVSDPCAWADIRFGKKAANDPTIGHLKAGECRCTGFPTADELIALRSPHAFMEWTTLKNVPATCWLSSSAMYFSVHDLTFRILQMDFDGDHVLVIDDPHLISIVKKIKKEYNIPVIYYEPSAASAAGLMETRKDMFAAAIVECILNCLKTNKVGQYSNLATAAWSKFDPNMSKEQIRALLCDIAVLAAGINHAVDAQKTYKLNELSREIVKKYNFKPYNERFKNANLEKPHGHASWDQLTAEKGNGSVDRLGDVVASATPDKLMIDTSNLHFDWRMLQEQDPRFNKQVSRAVISRDMLETVENFGKTDSPYDAQLLDNMQNGRSVGLPEFFRLLRHQNKTFFETYKQVEDDCTKLSWTNQDRYAIIRSLIVDFVRKGTSAADGMTDSEVLRLASVAMLKNVFTKERNLGCARFVIDVFGDYYADAATENIANGYTPEIEEEITPQYEDVPFNPDFYDVPDEAYFDTFQMNELDDLYYANSPA